jgi:hypothetical protein
MEIDIDLRRNLMRIRFVNGGETRVGEWDVEVMFYSFFGSRAQRAKSALGCNISAIL